MSTQNPLIQDNPEDTLHHTHCLLQLLEVLHASNDSKPLSDESICLGAHALLKCANQALVYEMERMHQALEKSR